VDFERLRQAEADQRLTTGSAKCAGKTQEETEMLLFIIIYGAALIIASAFIANQPNYLGNVGFLMLGAAFGSYPPFLIAEYYAYRDRKRMATAIFHELSNRVARCCFDFEAPWQQLRSTTTPMDISRLKKFAPIPPVIYPALAPHISIFNNDIGQTLIRFYIFLSAWEKDIQATAEEFESKKTPVNPQDVHRLSSHLRRTLKPGKDALEGMAKSGLINNPEQIEAAAIIELDKLFPAAHPLSGKPLRERIQIALDTSQ